MNKVKNFIRLLSLALTAMNVQEKHIQLLELRFGISLQKQTSQAAIPTAEIALQREMSPASVNYAIAAAIRKIQQQAVEEALGAKPEGPCRELILFVDQLRLRNGIWNKKSFYEENKNLQDGMLELIVKLGNYNSLYQRSMQASLILKQREQMLRERYSSV